MKARSAKAPAVVLPVGGGKGGIGKSAVTANLGLALARLEHSVTVVDADLGGSDLHNFLGLDNDLPGLGEVLTGRGPALKQVVHPVLEPRFGFVPGDAMVVATANPSFQKKRKLLHGLKALPGDFVLLDLGAGASITVMDFFLTSPVSLVVMLPERPAVENAYNFLKNALFRALLRILRGNSACESALAEYQVRSRGPGAMNLDELCDSLDAALAGTGDKARRIAGRWRPKLVLNRVRRVEDFEFASKLEGWARRDLGLSLEVMAFLPEDEVLHLAHAKGVPALDLDPRAPFCRAVALLALRVGEWAGRAGQWAAHSGYQGSFQRAATEFSAMFPPPGTEVPTRAELLRRLRRAGEA